MQVGVWHGLPARRMDVPPDRVAIRARGREHALRFRQQRVGRCPLLHAQLERCLDVAPGNDEERVLEHRVVPAHEAAVVVGRHGVAEQGSAKRRARD